MSQEIWIRDQWATTGCTNAISVSKKIYSKKSKYQQIDIYDTHKLGRLLTLDGIIMLTDFDEFAYHEMITHPAMHVHPNPEKVLVVGGGDGGTVREVLKHKSVKHIDLCELDEEVIIASKEHLPQLSKGLSNKKVDIHCMDAAEFVKGKEDEYDVIISDSSDPIGPCEVLFQKQFYENMYNALKKDGIAVTQSEGMFFDSGTITKLFKFNKKIFPHLSYYYSLVPTYPSGTIGFSFCSKKYDPIKNVKDKGIKGLKYYNQKIHKSAFVLPTFMDKIL